jgi:hypothetical protein
VHEQAKFNELADAGVFEALFQETERTIVEAWKQSNDIGPREELHSRLRALRDLRRTFNKSREIEAA